MNEHVYDARAGTQHAEVLSINDTGQAMTATVRTSSGAVYSDIEVVQAYGCSSNPVLDGALAVVFALGGDPANMRAMLYNPSWRYGNQQAGEATIFAPDGTRVSVRLGGIVDIKAGNQINIIAPNATVTATTALTVVAPEVNVTAPAVNVTGNVNLTGNLLITSGTISVDGVRVNVP